MSYVQDDHWTEHYEHKTEKEDEGAVASTLPVRYYVFLEVASTLEAALVSQVARPVFTVEGLLLLVLV